MKFVDRLDSLIERMSAGEARRKEIMRQALADGMGIAYWYPDQIEDMAKAAAMIFDANARGQEYADRERS